MTRLISSLDRIVCQIHVPILILLIGWSGLGLASPTHAQESEEPAEGTVKKKVHPERRAHEMFKQISKTPGVDLDGNGKVSREERTAFLLALAVQGDPHPLRASAARFPFRSRRPLRGRPR